MRILKKNCLYCRAEIIKPYHESLGNWEKHKYCSKGCYFKSKKGITAHNKGKRLSEEYKKKRKIIKHRIKLSLSHKERLVGEKNHNWRGGISSKNDVIRHSIESRLWRESVFARDNWTCQKTKIRGKKLQPHHIRNFSQYPELRFAIDNGITFSEEAHKEFHKIYGRKNNTAEQVKEFLANS